MNKFISIAVGASLALWFGLGADPVCAQSADLSEIGTDPRRALIVDVMILADGTAEFIESYVSDVPPGSSIGNPQHIMLESLDATSTVIGTEYSWDPRWVFFEAAQPDDNGIFGEQLEVQSEALGSFSVLFNKDIDSVRVSDVEAISELITVDVRYTVEKFCADEMVANPNDFNPECIGITFSDSDVDGIFDVLDNCPTEANANQTDTDGDSAGDACDLDDDNDGVADDQDQCPDTQLGEDIDTDGCANSQLDDDGDGVLNNFDQCPGTPIGPAVDANGCAESQLDQDGDGVPNAVDACPMEDASGFDVDHDGCIDSFTGLGDLIGKLVLEGIISAQMQNSLTSKVENAGSSSEKDKICTAVNELEAFKNQVAAQIGKKISDEAADQVIDYADSVIAYIESQLPAGETC